MTPFHVAFEGIDGAGKSTVARCIYEKLRERRSDVVLVDKESKRPIRAVYRELIRSEHMFPSGLASCLLGLADYVWTRDAIHANDAQLVLWDRYAYSSLADGLALGVDKELLWTVAARILPSNLTVLIDADPAAILDRKGSVSVAEAGGPNIVAGFGTLAEAFIHYQGQVRAAYKALGDSGLLGNAVVILDSTQLSAEAMADASLSRLARARLA